MKMFVTLTLYVCLLNQAAIETAKKWSYIGCVQENLLPKLLHSYPDNTLPECSVRCKQNGFSFAGVNSARCQCGQDPIPEYAEVNKNDCSLSCPEDVNKKCGGLVNGNHKMSMKNFNDTQWFCAERSSLPLYMKNAKVNTPDECDMICEAKGHTYAGVMGTHCYCGDHPPPVYLRTNDSQCDLKCSGDPSLFCGSGYKEFLSLSSTRGKEIFRTSRYQQQK